MYIKNADDCLRDSFVEEKKDHFHFSIFSVIYSEVTGQFLFKTFSHEFDRTSDVTNAMCELNSFIIITI